MGTTRGFLKKFFKNKKNWCKYAYEKNNGACCLMGAVNKFYPLSEENNEVIRQIANYIRRYNHSGAFADSSIVLRYNDSRCRKFEDIKKLVNKLDI